MTASGRKQGKMPARQVSVQLHPELFGESEKLIARSGSLTATAFRYGSGVAGLRVDNGVGTVTLLPFQGQQVWDAACLGRSLAMRSMFDEPQPTRDYLSTYGALFLHCGGTAMGNPGPVDTHPLHGELPNIPYTSAQLVLGEDDAGGYADLTGIARDTLAFDHDFVSRPRVRLREGSTVLDIAINVENRASKPLAFFYLAHINFRPADGGLLIDTVRSDDSSIVMRQPASAEASEWDAASFRSLKAGVAIEPEAVLMLKPETGEDGWAHALHRRPDGTGDFVSYRPSELPYAVRWITRSGDQDALGLLLPATAAPNGRAAAIKENQIVWIEPGASYDASLRFGAADAEAASRLEAEILTIRDS
jgi:hypothetical protein